jgi:hypothetical protein
MSWTGPDDPTPDAELVDGALPDSGTAPGSDAGEPGGHLGLRDLSPEEERLLAALERDAREQRADLTSDESIAFVRAAEDDAPLPAEGGEPDDGLSPRFMSPGEA